MTESESEVEEDSELWVDEAGRGEGCTAANSVDLSQLPLGQHPQQAHMPLGCGCFHTTVEPAHQWRSPQPVISTSTSPGTSRVPTDTKVSTNAPPSLATHVNALELALRAARATSEETLLKAAEGRLAKARHTKAHARPQGAVLDSSLAAQATKKLDSSFF